MKVYILFEEIQYGGDIVVDIYSNLASAEKAKATAERASGINKKMVKCRDHFWIDEREVIEE